MRKILFIFFILFIIMPFLLNGQSTSRRVWADSILFNDGSDNYTTTFADTVDVRAKAITADSSAVMRTYVNATIVDSLRFLNNSTTKENHYSHLGYPFLNSLSLYEIDSTGDRGLTYAYVTDIMTAATNLTDTSFYYFKIYNYSHGLTYVSGYPFIIDTTLGITISDSTSRTGLGSFESGPGIALRVGGSAKVDNRLYLTSSGYFSYSDSLYFIVGSDTFSVMRGNKK